MADMLPETPLTGGRVTVGVVRVGDTVRRPVTPNSDFVRRLLHLEDEGFDAAPRALGVDDCGRDVFSFIKGEAPSDLAFHEDVILAGAAALIRRFHDATASFPAVPAAGAEPLYVVCHNDLSPCNFVFRGGAPAAIIDFDSAAPGSRAFDLGYAAWLWLDLGSNAVRPADQVRRLALFRMAYGADQVVGLLPAIMQRQEILAAEARRSGDVAMATWAEDCLDWTIRHQDTLASGD